MGQIPHQDQIFSGVRPHICYYNIKYLKSQVKPVPDLLLTAPDSTRGLSLRKQGQEFRNQCLLLTGSEIVFGVE